MLEDDEPLTASEWAKRFKHLWFGSSSREVTTRVKGRCPHCQLPFARILRVDWYDSFELYCLNKDCGVMVADTPKAV